MSQGGQQNAHTLIHIYTFAGRGTDILLGGNSGFFARKRLLQRLAPALLDKKTGLPPKENLEIKQNPACIPLPDLTQETMDLIEQAAQAAKKELGSCGGMLDVESLIAVAAETGEYRSMCVCVCVCMYARLMLSL